ncbi:MAG: CRISPR-associated protein Cas4 [Candidatus Omnitrophica bacterium]|jgi:CRISPR-associated exonuclease Cas4|nr:CRISPR-associated protein Cas4 [Candidatus Omnitrophota bacterium]
MYNEEDSIQLSALQHFLFCPRQCALSYIEQVWEENILTAEGGVMHDRAHEEDFETRNGVRIERGMPLRSLKLGLNGKADVVEFHKDGFGKWLPFPVEYKHGKPKENNCDKVQLCAQAICLEGVLGVSIPAGAIFYGKIRHRLDVLFDEALRKETEDTAHLLHEFIKACKTPKPVYSEKCENCSLVGVCMPKIFGRKQSVEEYLREAIKE